MPVLMYTAPAHAMAEAVEGVTDALRDRPSTSAATPDFYCITSRSMKRQPPTRRSSAESSAKF